MKIFMFLLWLLLAPVRHGDRDAHEVALTFDACPTRGDGYDEAVVRALLREKIPATVFVSGRWAQAHPEHATELARHFEIGNHGHVHDDARQGTMTYEEALKDIRLAQEAIHDATGLTPRFYRPPAVKYNDEVLRAARDLGLTTVLNDVASGDPDPHLSVDGIVKYVLWKSKPGSIVVFHVNGRGYTTADTIPRIAAGLRRKGYILVTVGDLLGKTP